MKVRDIMTKKVVSIEPEMPLKEVIDFMVRSDVSSLPVLDAAGGLVGLVTGADVISKEAYGSRRHRALALWSDLLSSRDHRWVSKAAGSTAADIMTRTVLVCSPDEEISSVARQLLERRIKGMPVVEAGSVVGMVSRHDVLLTIDRPDALITTDVERAVTGDQMPDAHQVRASVADGVVTLTGDVLYRWDEPVVVSIVREIPGVIDVISRLRHRESNPRSPAELWIFAPR